MKLTARIPVTAALVGLLLCGVTGCDKLKSRDQINKGVQAFKNKEFEQAVDHFQNAIKLDPQSEDAKLYLATAYANRVTDGSTSPRTWNWRRRPWMGFTRCSPRTPMTLQR